MKPFNIYGSRAFQYSLELLAHLSAGEKIGKAELSEIALRYGLPYDTAIVDTLRRAGILTDELLPTTEFAIPEIPLSTLEQEYLSFILNMPESRLFLDDETIETLANSLTVDASRLESVQQFAPSKPEPLPDAKTIRAITKAIRLKNAIIYRYRTLDSNALRESVAVPWKLEFSAYDRRWWVILYDAKKKRTIKARVENLQDIELLGASGINEKEILEAVDSLMAEEPITVRVKNSRDALERCFIVFEHRLFQEARVLPDNTYELSFRYYRFDKNEILKKLLYIGPAVTLVRPNDLISELKVRIKGALCFVNKDNNN